MLQIRYSEFNLRSVLLVFGPTYRRLSHDFNAVAHEANKSLRTMSEHPVMDSRFFVKWIGTVLDRRAETVNCISEGRAEPNASMWRNSIA